MRILVRDPAFSLVSVLGLGVGLAACLLLLGFARYSWQYNAHVPDAGNVYVLKQRQNTSEGGTWFDQAPTLLRHAALAAPGVAGVSGYVNWLPLTVQADGLPRKLKSLTVLPGFAGMMGLQAIQGDLRAALEQPGSFAITEGAAVRLFGTADVLGRTVRASSVQEQVATLRIAAVLRDPPSNTTIRFEALNGAASVVVPKEAKDEALTGAGGWWGMLLVRVQPGAPLATVTAALQRAADQAPAVQNVPPDARERLAGRKVMEVQLSPLREAYFDRDAGANFFSLETDRGDAAVVAGLAAVGLLILLLAGINYANLATIRVIRRQREIGMRKVLGAGTGRLALQFVAESLLVSLLATAVGLLLAWLALPLFSVLMQRDLNGMLSMDNAAGAVLIGVALGLLTALYPAWVAFRVRPSQALSGRPDAEPPGSRRLRLCLATVQIAAAMGLAGYTMAVAWQTGFAIGASPGFDPAPLLVLDLPEMHMVKRSAQARGFMAALAREPGVAGVAVSTDAVGRGRNQWSTGMKREGGESVQVDVRPVSANFFALHGVLPVSGRLFSAEADTDDSTGTVVINALAAQRLGFGSPAKAVGQLLLSRAASGGPNGELKARRIVGIAPDLRFHSLREAPHPAAYELSTGGTTLTVRTTAPLAEVERAVRAVWPRYFPNSPLEMRAASDIFAANYADDGRLSRLLAVATVIALLIAAIGAYVLAADAVQRRTPEIALRKLYGARRRDIGKLIARQLGVMLVLPAALGLPVAAVAIMRYLAGYTEHAAIGLWTLAFAFAIGAAIVALAGARHARIAMRLKPVVALQS
ncbi:ABC transporter permease [Pseudoduganella sp. LjRoot289]|uniref:FtsX-like permease family protein n=1 Tax=Pseudoduganella sp. LjRoot289 TaxID=3342314 RepID=UPI003ECC7112